MFTSLDLNPIMSSIIFFAIFQSNQEWSDPTMNVKLMSLIHKWLTGISFLIANYDLLETADFPKDVLGALEI